MKIFIAANDDYYDKLSEKLMLKGYEVVQNDEITDVLLIYGLNKEEICRNVDEKHTKYKLLVIAYPLNEINEIYSDIPTLLIKNSCQMLNSTVLTRVIDSCNLDEVVEIIWKWSSNLYNDIQNYGLPIFYKIRAEEISCRIISFDEENPVGLKIV